MRGGRVPCGVSYLPQSWGVGVEKPRCSLKKFLEKIKGCNNLHIAWYTCTMSLYIPHLEDAIRRLHDGEDYEDVYRDLPKPSGIKTPVRRRTNILTATDKARLKEYASIARHYRSSMSPSHPVTKSVREYEAFVQDLYDRGASIPEMADAANVSYNAMKKRVKP